MRKLVHEKPKVETVADVIPPWLKHVRGSNGLVKWKCRLWRHDWQHHETVVWGAQLKLALGFSICKRCGKSKLEFIL